MAKAGLPEPQSPEDGMSGIRRKYVSDTGAALCGGVIAYPLHPSSGGSIPSEGIQGDEWGAYVALDTYNRDEHGIT
jgi:hypothetical protein